MNEELKIIISAEIDKLKSELQKGQKEVENFTKKGKVSFDEFNSTFQKAGDAAKKGLAVVGTAVAGAATAILALGKSTEEYRTAQAKLTTAFEAAGSTAEQAKITYNDLYRVLGDGDVAVEAANHLAKLTTNQADLAEWTNICQGVYATFGDSLPIEGLTEAANETAKTGALTGSLADALNWAGVAEDEFQAKLDACATAQEREALIRETLNGLYSDAAAGYEENAAAILAQNEANAALEASMAAVGEAVAPINTALTQLGADILAQLAPYIQEFADKYLPDIVEALSGVGTAIGEVINWIAEHWELVSTLATIILGIAAAIAVVSTVMSVVNAVMMASPVTWIVLGIVAAIAALVAIIVVCVKHWDEIREAVGNFVEGVAEWFGDLWDSITEWFSDVIDGFVEWWNNLTEGFSEWWDNLVQGFTDFFSGIWESISEWWSNLVEGFVGFFSGIWESISTWWSDLVEGFTGFFSDVGEGISEWWAGLVEGFTGFFSDVWTGITGWWSDLTTGFSEWWGGIGEGLSGWWDNTKQGWSDFWGGVGDKVSEGKENVVNWFNNMKEDATQKGQELWNNVSDKFSGVKETMSNTISEAKDYVGGKLDEMKQAYDENGGGIQGIVAGAATGVKGLWTDAVDVMNQVTGGRFGEIVSAISGKLGEAWTTVSSILGKIKGKFEEIMNKAKTIVSGAIDKIKGFFDFKWELPKISLPHFSITGKFSLNPPQIPKFSVSWYQNGGVFDSPTLFGYGNGLLGGLGENGAEAVVPLEKNTQWLDRIAERLAAKQQPTILEVDGKVFAQTSIATINDLTRQTGRLALNIV